MIAMHLVLARFHSMREGGGVAFYKLALLDLLERNFQMAATSVQLGLYIYTIITAGMM